ncbi:MAG: hypothetical protein WA446_18240 [Steroidobacteraceae bacterium]
MQMQPLHEGARTVTARASLRRYTPDPRPQDSAAVLSERQDIAAALETASELIEMRYQEHLARMKLEALFAEGELSCL